MSHSELEFVVWLSLQKAVDVHLKPGSRCGAGTGEHSSFRGSCHSSQPPLHSVPSLWSPSGFFGDLGIRKSLPESTLRPRRREGHLLLGMKGPRLLLLTSTRMTTLPFLRGMGVYQLMTHTSSARHFSPGRQQALRLLGPPHTLLGHRPLGSLCSSPCPPQSHGPHWGLWVAPSEPWNLLRPPHTLLQVTDPTEGSQQFPHPL